MADDTKRLVLRTNHDDWRELSTTGLDGIARAGHSIPEFVWLDLLRAAGVDVQVVDDDFGVNDPAPTDDVIQMVMHATGVNRDDAVRALVDGRAKVRVDGREYQLNPDGTVCGTEPPSPTVLAWFEGGPR